MIKFADDTKIARIVVLQTLPSQLVLNGSIPTILQHAKCILYIDKTENSKIIHAI